MIKKLMMVVSLMLIIAVGLLFYINNYMLDASEKEDIIQVFNANEESFQVIADYVLERKHDFYVKDEVSVTDTEKDKDAIVIPEDIKVRMKQIVKEIKGFSFRDISLNVSNDKEYIQFEIFDYPPRFIREIPTAFSLFCLKEDSNDYLEVMKESNRFQKIKDNWYICQSIIFTNH